MSHGHRPCERLVKKTKKTFSEPVVSKNIVQTSTHKSICSATVRLRTSTRKHRLALPDFAILRGDRKLWGSMIQAAGTAPRSKSISQRSKWRTSERTLVMMSASFSVVLTRCIEIGCCAKKRKQVSAWTRRYPSFPDEPLLTAMRSAPLST